MNIAFKSILITVQGKKKPQTKTSHGDLFALQLNQI